MAFLNCALADPAACRAILSAIGSPVATDLTLLTIGFTALFGAAIALIRA